jgi:predicted DNA-binding antitoxin AbrB/MazE fold protein
MEREKEVTKMAKAQKVIEAVYSGGVFKPLEKVSLPDGEKVEIEIKEKKAKKIISLRGMWKGIQISEEDIEKAKHMWKKGAEKQTKILEED